MADPTEDEICMVIEIAGLDLVNDRSLVIQALKVRLILHRAPFLLVDVLIILG